MKQSATLELVDAGTLTRPGPIGRLFRLALGVLCLYALANLVFYVEWTTMQPFTSLGNRLLLLLAPLCAFNYVVNIGFSKSWGHRPLIGSAIFLLTTAISAYLVSGSPIFGAPLN